MALFTLLLFSKDLPQGIFPPAFIILICLFAAVLIGSQIRRKIITSIDKIIIINIFGKNELFFSNIKGFRIGYKVVYIVPVSTSNPKITIKNYYDFANYEDLIKLLRQNIKELNKDDLK